jgi:hypothetical protein
MDKDRRERDRRKPMKIDVHLHFPIEITQKLDKILDALGSIRRKEATMSVELDNLAAQVKANGDAEASAIVLIKGLADQIAAAKTDPVALQALSDSLKASATSLSEAITANTPAA